LNECPLPHNKERIDSNTKARDSRRTSASSTVRYYTHLKAADCSSDSPSSSSHPGVLSPALLDALALSPLDPPPWLAAMKRLG
jgi:hypothetical protein